MTRRTFLHGLAALASCIPFIGNRKASAHVRTVSWDRRHDCVRDFMAMGATEVRYWGIGKATASGGVLRYHGAAVEPRFEYPAYDPCDGVFGQLEVGRAKLIDSADKLMAIPTALDEQAPRRNAAAFKVTLFPAVSCEQDVSCAAVRQFDVKARIVERNETNRARSFKIYDADPLSDRMPVFAGLVDLNHDRRIRVHFASLFE
jgi:hypothetical protein